MHKLIIKLFIIFFSLIFSSILHAVSTECLDKSYTVQLLGSGGPISDDARASSGTAIWINEKSRILIDAGGGVYLRFGQSGARLEDIQFIGITHFHTDHSADLPALLMGGYFFNRTSEVVISGPTGRNVFPSLSQFMQDLFGSSKGAYAYLSGIFSGTDGMLPIAIINVSADTKHITKVFSNYGYTIYAIGIPHGNVPNLAYRIEAKNKVIVISSDQNGSTSKDFIKFAKGADVLVMPLAIDENADKISSTMHAKPSVVGKIASMINPKILILNHLMGRSLKERHQLLEIVKNYYKGPTFLGRDLECFPISDIK